jgi:hypothetical protein
MRLLRTCFDPFRFCYRGTTIINLGNRFYPLLELDSYSCQAALPGYSMILSTKRSKSDKL